MPCDTNSSRSCLPHTDLRSDNHDRTTRLAYLGEFDLDEDRTRSLTVDLSSQTGTKKRSESDRASTRRPPAKEPLAFRLLRHRSYATAHGGETAAANDWPQAVAAKSLSGVASQTR